MSTTLDTLDGPERAGVERAAYESLSTFADVVFSKSFAPDGGTDESDGFTRGSWVRRRCEFLQSSNKTCDIGPRNHLKSTGFYIHILWKIFRAKFNADPSCPWATGPAHFEIHYFSYKQNSAGYHIGMGSDSIKNLIERNPYFVGLEDKKPTAETKAKYSWDGEHEITITPHGMLSHVRGIHAGYVYVDDPFQDPENDLNPTKVLKINNVFRAGVSSIPKTEDGDEIHVTTTPQTREDFTFDEELLSEYEYMSEPAIRDEATESVLWPEWMDYDDLQARKRELGEKLFAQEYLCSPKASEMAFFTDARIRAMTVPELSDWGSGREMGVADGRCPELTDWLDSSAVMGVVAGFDIGKKRHPSHLAVFAILRGWFRDSAGEVTKRNAGHVVELHQKWMDEWNYPRQVDYIEKAIDYFGIQHVAYDNTRGEFESLHDLHVLPDEMTPVSLTGSSKDSMAGALDIFSSGDRVALLPDGRQRRQLGVVTNDLDAVETAEGHGEPFTSIGLAVWQAQKEHWGERVYSLEM